MAKLRFHAYGEHLPVEAFPELVAEFDGIRYRAKVTEANSRMFRAQLIEPFCRSITCELPVFVVAMSSFRLVRDGQPTTEMLKLLHSKMETAHQESLRRSSIEVAFALDDPRCSRCWRGAAPLQPIGEPDDDPGRKTSGRDSARSGISECPDQGAFQPGPRNQGSEPDE